MFIVVLNDGQEISFHIGTKKPEIWQPKDQTKSKRFVTEIQADCDELKHILVNFANLPFLPDRSVVRWFGDDAKFIFHNLK